MLQDAGLGNGPHWSLLRLSPQKQTSYVDLVKEHLPGMEVYYPVYSRMCRPHGTRRVREVKRPVYPGYVFLMVGNGDMHGPVSLPVRATWVRFGGVVETIPQVVIQGLRALEKANELVREVKYVNPYYPGARVKVCLPVGDLGAIIVKLVGKNRAMVDMPVGRATVGLHQLQVV